MATIPMIVAMVLIFALLALELGWLFGSRRV